MPFIFWLIPLIAKLAGALGGAGGAIGAAGSAAAGAGAGAGAAAPAVGAGTVTAPTAGAASGGGLSGALGQAFNPPTSGAPLDPSTFNPSTPGPGPIQGPQQKTDFFDGGLLGKMLGQRNPVTPTTAPTGGQGGGGGGSDGKGGFGVDLSQYKASDAQAGADGGRPGFLGSGQDLSPTLSRLLLGDKGSAINQDPGTLRKTMATLLTSDDQEQNNQHTDEFMKMLERMAAERARGPKSYTPRTEKFSFRQ